MLKFFRKIFIAFILGVFFAIGFNVTMNLVIHRKRKVITPDIRGLPLKKAIEKLAERDLYIRIVGRRHSENIPPDSILSQDPLPGEIVRKERPVKVVLSEGSELVYVPDLKNLSLQEAEILLKRSFLVLGEINKVYSNEYKKGRIISQEPEEGEIVKKGSMVSVIVSKGPSTISGTFLMPDVVGKNIEEVKDIFFDMGIEIDEKNISKVVNNRVPDGTVLKQIPPPGELIEDGSEISLVISERREIKEILHVETFYFEIPQGPDERHLKVIKEDLKGKEVVIDSIEKPGTKILKEIKMYGKAKVLIYLDDTLVEVKKYE
ncbi:MAG: hypothetical protein DRI36_01975 [Caldiserica bacterium]|nr:MAG: hypothetical protein DRI36_01975 [Caldisericota bacterium]